MKKFISIKSVETKAHSLSNKIKNDPVKHQVVVGMSRGGLIPAALIATELNLPLVTMYIDKKDKIYLDQPDWLFKKNVLFVDDVCRTGKTLKKAMEHIATKSNPDSVEVATLINVTSMEKQFVPTYCTDSVEDVKFPWDYDR